MLNIVQQTDAEFSELSLHEATPAEKDEAENMKNKGLCWCLGVESFISLFQVVLKMRTRQLYALVMEKIDTFVTLILTCTQEFIFIAGNLSWN